MKKKGFVTSTFYFYAIDIIWLLVASEKSKMHLA